MGQYPQPQLEVNMHSYGLIRWSWSYVLSVQKERKRVEGVAENYKIRILVAEGKAQTQWAKETRGQTGGG